ncbi:VWA domain-containing protein [Luteolibacter algae]|uniref:VWA domain-containing protein n=1 Tax=Luteolibacter algae TaxID=454151 RepID=A0ABW5D6P6_9BACT
MKFPLTLSLALAAIIAVHQVHASPARTPQVDHGPGQIDPKTTSDDDKKNRIQIALLLDTSNSMDGLIDQAKTQLWKVVNTFIDAKRDGETPYVEVALYEYGNNGNAMGNDWIRLVSPLSRDLDGLSKQLFSLKTNGGEEFCGAVIQRALGDLTWDPRKSTYKVIFIAGNESFTQGRVDARAACKEAMEKNIVVNTIHCGDRGQGIAGFWHDGAALAGGDFLIIDQDRAVPHVDAPQDERISKLSQDLNKTYIGYGRQRKEASANQKLADADAEANAKEGAAVQRAITKASNNYSNASWDLVDAVREKKVNPYKLDENELPENLRKMTPEERADFIENAAARRMEIQSEIKKLNKEREAHVAAELKKQAESGKQTLDQAMIEITRKQAKSLGYQFEE